jgi:hypothetical protein
LLIAPKYKFVDKAPEAGTEKELVTPFFDKVKAFDPVLETVINPKGPVDEIPDCRSLFIEAEMELVVA